VSYVSSSQARKDYLCSNGGGEEKEKEEERDCRKAFQGKLKEGEGEEDCKSAGLPEAGGRKGGGERERWAVRRCWEGKKEGGSERGGWSEHKKRQENKVPQKAPSSATGWPSCGHSCVGFRV